jgi:UDP-N-acetylmuramate: L-alanyl-gamma-D-glutamyl-meso-diaminopimelate ligase
VQNVLAMGYWTPVETLSSTETKEDDGGWRTELQQPDGSVFKVLFDGKDQGTINWSLIGNHNVSNALAAIAAARHAGVPTKYAIEALAEFKTPKRRMEVRGVINNITIYDDFAHHPTAIKSTLAGLREKVGNAHIIAILEPRSNTMRLGIHKNTLGPSLSNADSVMLYVSPDLSWDSSTVTTQLENKAQVFTDINTIVENVTSAARNGDHILIMSNGGFGGLHDKLLHSLEHNFTTKAN